MNATTKCVTRPSLLFLALARCWSPGTSTFITPCSIFDIQILMAIATNHASRLRQRHRRIRTIGEGSQEGAQEFNADAQCVWKSNDEEPVSGDLALAEEGGSESQGCSR